MLSNINQSRTLRAINEITFSAHEFYLTGSYFFATNTCDSDMDFMVVNSPGVIDLLQSLGFVASNHYDDNNHYDNSSVNSVYKLEDCISYDNNTKTKVVKVINVQLLHSKEWLDRKLRAQEALKISGLGKILDLFPSDTRKMVWQCILHANIIADVQLHESNKQYATVIKELVDALALMGYNFTSLKETQKYLVGKTC